MKRTDNNLKLDIFPHIFPLAYFERMKKIAEGNPALAAQLKRWMHIPVLWDLERRMKMMKRWPGYKQVLTLSMPAWNSWVMKMRLRNWPGSRTTAWPRSWRSTPISFPPSSPRCR